MKTELCSKPSTQFHSTIDVNVSDIILTPLACASLINEIAKTLLYQKTQMPYPYTWLKNIVDRKRKNEQDEEASQKKINFTVDRHYRTVSKAYDSLNDIMTSIKREFADCPQSVKEVVFVIGTTPVSPKEVFTIRVSSLALGHVEGNHSVEISKKQSKILREIFFSESWLDSTDSMVCTNTYVFLKKAAPSTDDGASASDTVFMPAKPLFVPSKARHLLININYDNTREHKCCDRLEVFQDGETPVKKLKTDSDASITVGVENSKESWTQSTISFQGFKDCFINKVSACQLW